MELKALIVRLILKYGISYSTAEYKKTIKTMESQGLLVIHREPPLTPKTGKPATSMNYDDYLITVGLL